MSSPKMRLEGHVICPNLIRNPSEVAIRLRTILKGKMMWSFSIIQGSPLSGEPRNARVVYLSHLTSTWAKSIHSSSSFKRAGTRRREVEGATQWMLTRETRLSWEAVYLKLITVTSYMNRTNRKLNDRPSNRRNS